ncbi:dedicator of cytokinesis protein 7 [Fopius arisanus]|uniref:Dedicator of cytokinesis protein 7 n=1 Tax=Fopius arisanus TaxID=64838 RepID=A0A9R1SVI0_9HYME|nr:PREDICTED: dedicator of cytokinesis protein 7 [Fopius arisanus]XP_011297901.1 PREDICTED: dedicator of cytokinesis protein 7 [Fopius arisanus]
MSVQRAFAHKLSKQHAADVRRQIASSTSYSRDLSKSGSSVSGFSSTMSLCEVLEPLDYEDFLTQHQTILDRDPLRPILDFPPGDVELRMITRKIRTEEPVIPFESLDTVSPYIHRCIDTFTSDWLVIHRKYKGRISPIARERLLQDTPRQDFEVDQEDTGSGSPEEEDLSCAETPRGSWASLDLRHSQHDPLLPGILDRVCPETVDQVNEQKRCEDRQEAVFPLYALPTSPDDEWQEIASAVEPSEPFSHRILVKCLQLKLELEVEPIFACLALYDSRERKKVSENFYVDMNSDSLKRMLGGHIAYSDASTLARSCVLSISKPSPDLFLVVRLEKVLQGDISECAEPYLREDKNKDKVKAAALAACERLGRYRMPLAWTAIHLSGVIGGGGDTDSTGSAGSLDRKSGGLEQWRKKMDPPTRRGSLERRSSDKRRSWSPDDFANCLDSFRPITLTVSSFFKQESERLRDEDLYKLLLELRRPGSNLKRLKCLPGILKLDLSPRPDDLPRCLDPDLRRLSPYPDEKNRPIKEILEFPAEIVGPDLMYRNLLYVYPKEVNFNSRTGSARNIAVRIQLMGGEQESDALTAIFGRSSCPEMTHEAFTSVSYHNKNPSFYDEVKIRLPADLSARHHLLFTFYHISCQKKAEQPNVETPVAYTWLPLLRDGHLQSGEFSLPAMLDPPPSNYSYIAPDVQLPGTRWVDAHRGVFSIILEPISSVHPQDKYIDRFLSLCGSLETGQVPPRIGEAGMESELKSALLELSRAASTALVRCFPQIFDQLISLLVHPPTLPSQPLNVAATVFEAIGLLVKSITSMPDGQVDAHGRHALLATYTAFQCSIPRMSHGPAVIRAQSNPDLPVEDLEMEIHARGLDRTASMRQESPSINSHIARRLLHEELALHWVVSTGQARELAVIHSWFFLELIVRSMVIHLAEVGGLEAPRKNRYSPQFSDDVATLTAALTTELIHRCGKDPRVSSNLISSIGNFLSDLLSTMDRGFILSLIRATCCSLTDASMHVPDSAALFSLKLDLVRTVCSHEHYVALNLPFGTGYTSGSAPASPSPSTGSSGSLISTLVPGERARFSELSQEFRQQHFLVGLILSDLANTLEVPNPMLQNKAIGSVRHLMNLHDGDPRYSDPAAKARVAALYLPLLNILMDALPQLYHWDSKDKSVYTDESGSITQSVALAIAGGGSADVGAQCRVSLSSEATRHLLMCFLWVLKGLEKSALAQWCSELSARRVLSFLQVLSIATAAFEYKGKKALKRLPQQATATSDIRSRLEDVILGQGSARSEMMLRRKERITGDKLRWRKDQMPYRTNEQPEGRAVEQDAHIEGALAAEASLVVLDSLESVVQADCGGGAVVGAVLKVLLRALARNQSTSVLQHMFNTQRALVFKYHSALFDEESERCGDLCLTLLTRCSSPLSAIRSHAAASLYLLMRQNFEIGNNFARVKMQVTTSLSALVGRGRAPSEGALRRALKTVLVYAERDTELADTSFPEQVKDLLFNLHMILSDTVKMKEFQEDPEMLLDLMYRIAKGYQGSPDLRLTWLANMAQQHMERKNHTEAAMCLVHSAALVAEYLHLLEPGGGGRPVGAVALAPVTPNALEESAVGDDVLARREEGLCLGPDFSESGLAGLLEHAASSFHAAGMYEAIPDVYRVLLPIAESAHDYKKLANIHGKLHEAYTRVDQLSGKRVFGTYFRVGFYGARFGDLAGEEFVYKEPTLTKLPEIFSRLENFYAERFGVENIVIIKDSNPVDISKLETDKAYVQITYVEPYFEPHELRHRPAVFHRNFNIKRFVYATPFTPGGKAHGELREQCKRKTILTVATHFPYLKTRIRVVARKQIVLSPIEVAIEDIQKKTAEVAAATVQEPPDPKILQMVLQGCIGTTVNQGPAEVAVVFLSGLREQNAQPSKLQHKLRLCFKDFQKRCLDALRRNKNLIGPDQRDYQRELERNYQRLTERLAPLIAWSGPPSMMTAASQATASPRW